MLKIQPNFSVQSPLIEVNCTERSHFSCSVIHNMNLTSFKWSPVLKDNKGVLLIQVWPCIIILWVNRKSALILSFSYIGIYQWLTRGQWFSSGTPVSSTNNTDRHDIAEILSKVALNTIIQPALIGYCLQFFVHDIVLWGTKYYKQRYQRNGKL